MISRTHFGVMLLMAPMVRVYLDPGKSIGNRSTGFSISSENHVFFRVGAKKNRWRSSFGGVRSLAPACQRSRCAKTSLPAMFEKRKHRWQRRLSASRSLAFERQRFFKSKNRWRLHASDLDALKRRCQRCLRFQGSPEGRQGGSKELPGVPKGSPRSLQGTPRWP